MQKILSFNGMQSNFIGLMMDFLNNLKSRRKEIHFFLCSHRGSRSAGSFGSRGGGGNRDRGADFSSFNRGGSSRGGGGGGYQNGERDGWPDHRDNERDAGGWGNRGSSARDSRNNDRWQDDKPKSAGGLYVISA